VTASPRYTLSSFPFPPQTAVRIPSAITLPSVLLGMRTPEGYSFTRNETTPLDSDTSQKRDQPRPRANPDLTPTPPTTVISTPVPRTDDLDGEWKNRFAATMMNRDDRLLPIQAYFLDTPGAETDSSVLTSLDINLEGGDPHDLSSCSVSDTDGPSSSPGSRSPHPRKRRRQNRLRRLLSPDNVQFLYDDTADVNGTSSGGHSVEYPHATHRRKPSLEVPIIASRERNITQEGSSPSTILPGNALQLHLAGDGPDGAFGSTPTATSFSSSCSSNNPTTTVAATTTTFNQSLPPPISLDDDQTLTVAARHPVPRVHFRSRVRITSGLHSGSRPRNFDSTGHNSTADDGIGTANTSASGSPSSSISAPLRYQADENNVLGPLGKRINSLAQTRNKRNGHLRRVGIGSSVSERTPFLRASEYGPAPDYTHQRRERGRISSESEDEDLASGLKREEDVVFGRWPWRIFNRHASTIAQVPGRGSDSLFVQWWAYQCGPVLCCCPDDGFEDDE